jgi:hypothetical protein
MFYESEMRQLAGMHEVNRLDAIDIAARADIEKASLQEALTCACTERDKIIDKLSWHLQSVLESGPLTPAGSCALLYMQRGGFLRDMEAEQVE